MFLGHVLYLSLDYSEKSGMALICNRNLKLIEANSTFIVKAKVKMTIESAKKHLVSIAKRKLVSDSEIASIKQTIQNHKIDTVFIDSSLLGGISKELKNTFKNLSVIVFFHNVEKVYFQDLIKATRKIHHYLTLKLIEKAEQEAVIFADVKICLNKRDSHQLKSFYNSEADFILPTSLKDTFDLEKSKKNKNLEEVLNLLFVGSYFPPNIQGINWFMKHVLPKLKTKIKLTVIGNGFENHRIQGDFKNVCMIGKVEDLSVYYYNSDLVIAPIFHGSGMKTKTAEAFMFGKPVAGSPEAFVGYDISIEEVGKILKTSDEFVDFINHFDRDGFKNVRKIFTENYSIENSFLKFKQIENIAND